jgi:hypothetical protein
MLRGMATTPKRKAQSRTLGQRTAPRPERLQPARLRLPDLRDPKVLAEIRREAKLMAQHPENDLLDDWAEAIIDWDDWPPFDPA